MEVRKQEGNIDGFMYITFSEKSAELTRVLRLEFLHCKNLELVVLIVIHVGEGGGGGGEPDNEFVILVVRWYTADVSIQPADIAVI